MARQRVWTDTKGCVTSVLWRGDLNSSFVYTTDPKDGFDFKLDEFFAAPSETFEPYYGEHFDCGI